MCYDKDQFSPGLALLQSFFQVVHIAPVQAAGRFIQHQDIWSGGQRRSNRDALFLPAGERKRVAVLIFLKAEAVQDFCNDLRVGFMAF